MKTKKQKMLAISSLVLFMCSYGVLETLMPEAIPTAQITVIKIELLLVMVLAVIIGLYLAIQKNPKANYQYCTIKPAKKDSLFK